MISGVHVSESAHSGSTEVSLRTIVHARELLTPLIPSFLPSSAVMGSVCTDQAEEARERRPCAKGGRKERGAGFFTHTARFNIPPHWFLSATHKVFRSALLHCYTLVFVCHRQRVSVCFL